jgi:N utilization substance protein B
MSRRAARELGLRALFMVEQGRLDPVAAIAEASASLPRAARSADPEFTSSLVHGTLSHRQDIEQQMLPHLKDWSWRQISAVDRAILRIAGYELMYTSAPVAAVIDEAVTLAKIYGTVESGRFVNGVLGSFARALPPE